MERVGVWLLGIAGAVVVAIVLAVFGLTIYLASTGGFTATRHERIDGIDCIVVYKRVSGTIDSVSCPPVQQR